MKRGGLHIHLSNRVAYTLIAILALAIVGVGVYAVVPTTSQNVGTAVFGHTLDEVKMPACTANQFLKFDGANWVCSSASTTEVDPTVNNYVKNKTSCVDITGGAGLCDGIDNVSSTIVGGYVIDLNGNSCSRAWGMGNCASRNCQFSGTSNPNIQLMKVASWQYSPNGAILTYEIYVCFLK